MKQGEKERERERVKNERIRMRFSMLILQGGNRGLLQASFTSPRYSP